jgi:hypothetical protein
LSYPVPPETEEERKQRKLRLESKSDKNTSRSESQSDSEGKALKIGKIRSICSSNKMSVFVSSKGYLYTMGFSDCGLLGLGKEINDTKGLAMRVFFPSLQFKLVD